MNDFFLFGIFLHSTSAIGYTLHQWDGKMVNYSIPYFVGHNRKKRRSENTEEEEKIIDNDKERFISMNIG